MVLIMMKKMKGPFTLWIVTVNIQFSLPPSIPQTMFCITGPALLVQLPAAEGHSSSGFSELLTSFQGLYLSSRVSFPS